MTRCGPCTWQRSCISPCSGVHFYYVSDIRHVTMMILLSVRCFFWRCHLCLFSITYHAVDDIDCHRAICASPSTSSATLPFDERGLELLDERCHGDVICFAIVTRRIPLDALLLFFVQWS